MFSAAYYGFYVSVFVAHLVSMWTESCKQEYSGASPIYNRKMLGVHLNHIWHLEKDKENNVIDEINCWCDWKIKIKRKSVVE